MFRKFEITLARPQQAYVAMQFAVYVALGSYLMDVAERVPVAALVLGWSLMAFGLFVLGALLENRPWAARLELARLVANAPALYLAGALGLAVVAPLLWWLLVVYSLFSLWGLGLVCRLALRAQSAEAPAQPQQGTQTQQATEHP